MTKAFDVKNLHVRFQNAENDTLNGVSFSVAPGEMVALVGESGSGKTLLCRALLGLPPEGAQVTGEFPADTPMSIVLQDPQTSLDPAMPVGKQILEAAQTKDKGIAVKMLSLVGIPDPERAQREFPAHFSGGMRQRVAIAIALTMNPQLLFADEPTTSLDADLAERQMGLFADIKKTGTAVVFVAHDLALVRRWADRILIIEKGKIIEEGTPDEIFESPQQEYTKRLIYYSSFSTHHHHGVPRENGVPIVSVKNLSKSYKYAGEIKPVLQNLSFSIYHGETLGICGRSGIGKSTLLRQLAHMEPPTDGAVEYSAELSSRQDVQMIFQDSRSALNPRMRIRQILGEALYLKTKKRPNDGELIRLLERVELPESLLDRYPHEISGGERQRIAIARAVSVSPKLILADEPVSSLDVAVRSKIVHLLRKLKDEENLTLVFVSHDKPLLEHVCDRILNLDV